MSTCPRCGAALGIWTNGAMAEWYPCSNYPECLYVVRIDRPSTETRQLRLLEVAA